MAVWVADVQRLPVASQHAAQPTGLAEAEQQRAVARRARDHRPALLQAAGASHIPGLEVAHGVAGLVGVDDGGGGGGGGGQGGGAAPAAQRPRPVGGGVAKAQGGGAQGRRHPGDAGGA